MKTKKTIILALFQVLLFDNIYGASNQDDSEKEPLINSRYPSGFRMEKSIAYWEKRDPKKAKELQQIGDALTEEGISNKDKLKLQKKTADQFISKGKRILAKTKEDKKNLLASGGPMIRSQFLMLDFRSKHEAIRYWEENDYQKAEELEYWIDEVDETSGDKRKFDGMRADEFIAAAKEFVANGEKFKK